MAQRMEPLFSHKSFVHNEFTRFRACIVAGLFNFFFFLSFGVMGDYSLLFFDNSIITMGRKDLNFECFR